MDFGIAIFVVLALKDEAKRMTVCEVFRLDALKDNFSLKQNTTLFVFAIQNRIKCFIIEFYKFYE